MHIPDGYLGPVTYGSLWVAMAPIWSLASRKVQREVGIAQIPHLAMAAVFSLLAMLLVLPIPGGTTGHISGAALVAILLGPWAAIMAVSIALVIQAAVLGDGGLTAIAPNCFNIAVLGAFVGSGVYRLFLAAAGRAGEPSTTLRAVAGAVAAYLAINVGALSTACMLGLQPAIYGTAAAAGYFPYPLTVAIPAIMLPHLTAVGALEATVTALVLVSLGQKGAPVKYGMKMLPWVLVATALLAATGASAHSVNYQVAQQGLAVRAFYEDDAPAANARYELYGPGDKEPHQVGSTDRRGWLGFVPDRPGVWRLQVWGESSHGFHGVSTEIRVDRAMGLEGYSKPLVATWTKLVTGVSLAFGLFGVWALWASRRKDG